MAGEGERPQHPRRHHFYELQLVNQSSSVADGTMDLRLLRRRAAVEALLLRFDELRRSADRGALASTSRTVATRWWRSIGSPAGRSN